MRKIDANCLGVRFRLAALFCTLSVAGPGPTTATEPNFQPEPEMNPCLQIYDFAMIGAGFDFKQMHPDWFDVVLPTKLLPSTKNEFGADGTTYFGVRQKQKRFGTKSEVLTVLGPLSTILEAESNSQAKPETPPWMQIYGFAIMDAGFDFKQVHPDWFDVVRPTKLPSTKNEFGADGNTYFSVRQTRFGTKSEVPTVLGPLSTVFEFELFGTGAYAGQTTFRVRHAFGELGQFGGGQTWSPFMDIDVFPNSVEYWGPAGMVLFRNLQFRWMPLKGDSRITLAVERPGASARSGTLCGQD